MRPLYYIVLCSAFLLLTKPLLSQGAKGGELRPVIGGGFLSGGSFSPNQFNYLSGGMARFGLQRSFLQKHDVALILGVNQFDKDVFFPLAVQFRWVNDPNKALGLLTTFGYSSGKGEFEIESDEYELEGGFYFELGAQWKFDLGKDWAMMPSVSLSRQPAILEFTPDFGDEYKIKDDRIALMFAVYLQLGR